MSLEDGRRIHRVHLLRPLPGSVGAIRIFVIDASVRGFRIAHQESLGAAGDRVRIEFDYEGQPIRARCELRWTASQRVGRASYSRSLFHSGLHIHDMAKPSKHALIELIGAHVMRALDEQRANARGIPPLAAASYQSGASGEFVRHEWTSRSWRAQKTADARQPNNGFTIAANVADEEVAMLRSSYETGDLAAREMIRKLAAASVNIAEGVPSRRYTP